MTKAGEKKLRTALGRAEAELERLREALAAPSAGTAPEAAPARRATRHSRDLGKRLDRLALALRRARALVDGESGS